MKQMVVVRLDTGYEKAHGIAVDNSDSLTDRS